MDYVRVLQTIAEFLRQIGHCCAVAGGWAMNSYGRGRTTFDLDLIVPFDAQEQVVEFLESRGYETLHLSSGYSNHLHAQSDWGRVDLIYVRGQTREKLFSEAREREVFPGVRALVPRPEHLAAMKVTALRNDPSRKWEELADIRTLLRVPGVDAGEVREYFERHGLAGEYEQIAEDL